MRLYIVTAGCIQNVVKFFELSESMGAQDAVQSDDSQDIDEAKAIVFYHTDDMVKLSDVAVLYDNVSSVELLSVVDRDDMLVLLGTLIHTYADTLGASIMILDSELKVPKRYELKVTVANVQGAKPKPKTRTRKRRSVKPEPMGSQDHQEDVNPAGVEGELNPPEDLSGDTDDNIDDKGDGDLAGALASRGLTLNPLNDDLNDDPDAVKKNS